MATRFAIHPSDPPQHLAPRLIKRTIMGVAVATAAAGLLASPASADPGGSTDAHVGVTSGITMTGLTNGFTLTGSPGTTVEALDAVTFNVETNNVAGYTVTVAARNDTLRPGGGGNLDFIPVEVLTVREGGSYLPLSTAPLTVHSQSNRSVNGGDSLSNDFQIRIPVVNEDTYSVTLDYVAATL